MAITFKGRDFRTIEEIEVKDREVFFRADLNVPLKGGMITDDNRIRAILPTLKYLLLNNARVTLASHLGRPKSNPDSKYSLLPVAEYLAKELECEVILPDDCIGDGVARIQRTRKAEEIVLLENLRFHPEEKKNDLEFAKKLKGLTEIYVTDAFGAMHRSHASVEALPGLYTAKVVGFLVENEIENLRPLLANPERPYGVILGGAKVSDKIGVIKELLRKVDHLFIGGAMAFTFLKAKGHAVGKSLVEADQIPTAEMIMSQAKSKGVALHFPTDFVVGDSVENPGKPEVIEGAEIPEGKMGLDIGPKTLAAYQEELRSMKTIFWNGPMGVFEVPPFHEGTRGIAKALAEMTTTRVIGGGDSAAAVRQTGLADRMTHISTGGGATLELLEGKSLPGLTAVAV